MKGRQFFTSLSARLGWSFAALAVLAMIGAGLMHDWSMAKMLAKRSDAELIGKVKLVRHLLTEVDTTDAIRASPFRILGAVVDHPDVVLILRSSQGEVLATNAPLPQAAALPWPAAGLGPVDADSVHDWRSISGESGRIVSARGKLPVSDAEVDIIVARTAAERTALLDAIRRDMVVTLGAASLAAVLVGHALVRRGLRPVRQAAAKAREITASNLGERLHLASAPDELKDLVESFNQMLDRLQAAFQRISQFSSDLAHEFRTPISNLMVQSQVAMTRPRPVEEYQALLASNIEELERLSRMIENMLFLARAENSQLVLCKEAVDIEVELARVIEYFAGSADEAGVRMSVDAHGTVVADRALLRRAISNVISNALRFTSHGGMVSVAAQAIAGGYVIRVQNPGPGIPPEHRERIFDRFYRVDPARGDSSVSTGLGLAIVRSIMELHGGQVCVSCSDGNTTEFLLIFPEAIVDGPNGCAPHPFEAGA